MRVPPAVARMKAEAPLPVGQHNIEIQENRAQWERKPALRAIYGDFIRQIAGFLTDAVAGQTVELGSGMGTIKESIPHCVTTDIFANPWLDRVETAYHLSFPDATIANLILFDVFHHLEFAGPAMQEAARVVTPGGRLIIFDHDMGLVPRLVCRVFHHEPLGLDRPMTWDAPAGFSPAHGPYYAAIGNGYRCFVRGEFSAQWSAHWKLIHCRRLSSFAWLACGGFRGRQLYPDLALPLVQFVDRMLSFLPGIFSARMLVVLERRA
jgi:SAM-dependent methyltransferase